MRRFAESMTWAEERGFAIDAAVGERMGFVRRTYVGLLIELCGVAAVTSFTIKTPALLELATRLMWTSYLLYIGVFFGLALVTRKMLAGDRSTGVQYAAAGLWVVFLGFLCAPLVGWAVAAQGLQVVVNALILTACVFTGLTAWVFVTKKDFSFLGGALSVISWGVIGFLVVGSLSGFSGGTFLTALIVLLFAGWILYDTSRVLHHRHVGQYVAASVDLLIDFVYMFIHILMLLMNRD
ncbi:MAG: Bax inhibitor-1/YccA family protein [Planctomycetota bacterium]|jgi:FtsH-binding integral membrane protein